jgi:hypothetical protein
MSGFFGVLGWQIVVQDPKSPFSTSFEWASNRSREEKAGMTLTERVYVFRFRSA